MKVEPKKTTQRYKIQPSKRRMYIRAIFHTNTVKFLIFARLVDESPRWLWSGGKTEEAVAIVTKASVLNYGNRFKEELAAFARKDAVHAAIKQDTRQKDVGANEETGGGMSGLFRMPNMRKRTLNMSLNW